jgi:hypothetical protein
MPPGVAQEAKPTSQDLVSDPQNKATLGETGAQEAGGEILSTVDYGKRPAGQ